MFMFFASVINSNRPLKKHGLSSVGSKGHICRLTTDFLRMYCNFPVIRLVNFVKETTVIVFELKIKPFAGN